MKTRIYWLAIFVWLLFGTFLLGSEANFLAESDFENETAITVWNGGKIVSGNRPDATGKKVLELNPEDSAAQRVNQAVVLPRYTASLRLSGWYQIKTGGKVLSSWPSVKIGFRPKWGGLIEDWFTAPLTVENSDWHFYEKTLPVPEMAFRCEVVFEVDQCPVALLLDDVQLELFDATGQAFTPQVEYRTNTAGWYPLESPIIMIDEKSHINLSRLNDAPAGKHGFLTTKGDQFVFEDGTPFWFWGINIVAGAGFPDKATAEKIAVRLARHGYNLVRFHHLDAAWARPNLFSEIVWEDFVPGSRKISQPVLNRLDYFIAQLKEQGIYVFLDLLVHRHFNSTDLNGLDNPGPGAKVAGMFNRHLIQLQKEFAEQLLTHYNPYTRTQYINEPAIVLSEIINESTLFWFSGLQNLAPDYQRELRQMFREWCQKQRQELPEGELAELLRQNNPLLNQFLYEVELQYFFEMRDFIRGLGYKMPLAGSNHWENWIGDLRTNAQLDWIDRHQYWDHPAGGHTPDKLFDNHAMVKFPQLWSLVGMSRFQVAQRPFTVSEWNSCWPNEYIAESPLIVASYAALHGWDGPIQFALSHGDYFPDHITGVFDSGNKPHLMVANLVATLIFRRQDVPAAATVYAQPLPVAPEYFHRSPLPELTRQALLTGRVLNLIDEKSALQTLASEQLPPFTETTKPLFESQNGHLKWNEADGTFIIDTERTQGALGFLSEKIVTTQTAKLQAESNFCLLFLSSLDDLPLKQAKSILLTAVSRAENTGQTFNGTRTSLLHEGTAPVLMEPVVARIAVKSNRPLTVEALDQSGIGTGTKLKVVKEGEFYAFQIGKERAFWYEIRR